VKKNLVLINLIKSTLYGEMKESIRVWFEKWTNETQFYVEVTVIVWEIYYNIKMTVVIVIYRNISRHNFVTFQLISLSLAYRTHLSGWFKP
jgi:hypothetical protein